MAAETSWETTQRSRQENKVAESKAAAVVGTDKYAGWTQRYSGSEGGIRGHTQISDLSPQSNERVKVPSIGTQISTLPAQTPTAAHHSYQRGPTVLSLTVQSEGGAEGLHSETN